MDGEQLVGIGTATVACRLGHGRQRSEARRVRTLPAAVAIVGALALGACSSQERTVRVVGRPVPAATDAQAASAVITNDQSKAGEQPSGVDTNPATATLPGPFTTVTVTITRADGTTFEWCLLVADTAELRQRGLQGVNDLAGYDGMLFRFGEDQATAFWMRETLVPLSVGFFRADGGFVSATDMDPCPDEQSAACPTFVAASRYADAIETLTGGLADARVAAGSRLAVGAPACQPGKT